MEDWKDLVDDPTTESQNEEDSGSWEDLVDPSESIDNSGYEGGPPVDLSVPPKRAPLSEEEIKANEQNYDLVSSEGIPMSGDNTVEGPTVINPDKNTERLAGQYRQYVRGSGNPNEDYSKLSDKMQLPDDWTPTTDMYEGVTDPWGFYDYVKSKSEGKSALLAPTYRNPKTGKLYVVPKPGDYENTLGANNWLMNDLADSARSVIKNMAVSTASLIDVNFGTKVAENIDKAIAQPAKATNFRDSLIREGAALTVGSILGAKAGKAMAQPVNSEAISRSMAYLFGMVGAVSVMDPDTETTVVGKNSLANRFLEHPLFEGVKVDDNMSFAQQTINKKLNLLMDAAVTAAPIEGGVRVAAWPLKLGKAVVYDAITPIFSDKARINTAVREIATKLGAETPEQIDDLVRTINKNKMEVIEFADKNIPDMAIDRTTMSAVAEGVTDRAAQIRAMELEKGVLETGSPLLRKKIEQPVMALKEAQKSIIDSRGGLNAIEGARNQLFTQAKNQVDDIANTVKKATADTLDIENDFIDVVTTNKYFGQQVKDLSQASGIDVLGRDKAAATDTVLKKLAKAIGVMTDKKNTLYDKIPDNATIDTPSFIEKLTDAFEYMPKGTQQELSRIISDDPDQLIPFKTINNEILPKVNEAIDGLMSGLDSGKTDPAAIRALMDLRKNITVDQLDHLVNNGDEATKKAALEARTFYKETFARFADDPRTPVGRLFVSWKEHFKGMRADRAVDDLTMWRTTGQNVVEGLSDKNRGGADQLINFMKRPEYKGKATDIIDVYKGDVSKKLATILSNSDDVTKIDGNTILSSMGDIGVTFQKQFPKEAAQMSQLINDLRTKKISLDKAKEVLKTTVKGSEEAEKRVYDSVLGNFITKEGKPTTNGYQIFKEMLRKPGNESQIDEVVSRIRSSNDPIANKGIEAAYFSYVEDILKGDNNIGFNLKAANELLDPKNSTWKYGEQIIQNKPLADAYRGAIQSVINEQVKRNVGSIATTPASSTLARGRQGYDTLITWTFGVLNSTATKMRSLGNKTLTQMDPQERILQIKDFLMSDPDYALQQLDNLSKSLKNGITKETVNELLRIGIRTGLYSDKDKPEFERQAQDLFRQGMLQKNVKVPEGVDLQTK